MAGRHAAKTSKKPTVIITVIAAVVVIAVVGVVLFFTLGNKNNGENTDPSQSTASTAAAEATDQDSAVSDLTVPQPDYEATQASSTSETESTQSSKIALPSDSSGSGDGTYIEATYYPTKAVDSDSNQECSLKEVFGSAYTGGYLVFKEDGTFVDTMSASSVDSGSYVIKDGKLVATYSNDKNMSVTVNSWDGTTPTEFVVNYGGYDVYFN